jgi:hypothetical protein
MKKIAAAKLELFLATARKYIGYQSELLGRNAFGNRVGYDSGPWSGAFIDVVAREAGLNLPSFTYTPAALAEMLRSGNVSRRPKPGDIAIFNFSSTGLQGPAASAFNMPAAGIVTDVRELRTNGRFLSIEGNATGATSYQDKDGVHQRVRYLTDVVIFCRPAEFESSAFRRILQLLTNLGKKLRGQLPDKLETKGLEELTSQPETVRLRNFKPGTRNRSIEVIQLALSQVTDLQGAERGKWDAASTAACARFQRTIGRVGPDATGALDIPTLQRLSQVTGLFIVGE